MWHPKWQPDASNSGRHDESCLADWSHIKDQPALTWAERSKRQEGHFFNRRRDSAERLRLQGSVPDGPGRSICRLSLEIRWFDIGSWRPWCRCWNQAIGELRERLNHRPFRKRQGSRASVFEALDKPALKPLPSESFEISEWSRARVNIDYHVAFDGNLYSVPYNLVHELVEIRATPTTLEILHRGGRIASHTRSRGREQIITNHEHRPKSHQAHLEWTPSRMVHLAQTIGPHTAQLFERILADKPHPEMGYRACLGLIRLAGKYSPARMEAAAQRAVLIGACRYRSVESILKNALDCQPLQAPCNTS